MLERVVSGGQTGVDRAALDAALEIGLQTGGWCPAGRLAEDGRIAAIYPLRETPSAAPEQRTEWNVRDSDATLILSPEPLTGGTALTYRTAVRWQRPVLVLDPRVASPQAAVDWLAGCGVRVLNVAGPRESEVPGVHAAAHGFLLGVLRAPTGKRGPQR